MEDSVIFGFVAIMLILAYSYGAFFHGNLFPRASKDAMRDVAEYVAYHKRIRFDASSPLPSLFIGTEEELLDLLVPEERLKFFDYEVWGLTFRKFNRIALARNHSRIDMLVHELAHWFEEGGEEGENETEAWRITRMYLQSLYPSRYYFIVLLYGWTGIWGYEFGKPIFEITAL